MQVDLDVRDLPPCEPMEQILDALKKLGEGDCLCVHHQREPFPLYPLLEKGGFAWRAETHAQGDVWLSIWRADDAIAAAAIEPR
jgi:uncharacterized protein (DUF2249 family)